MPNNSTHTTQNPILVFVPTIKPYHIVALATIGPLGGAVLMVPENQKKAIQSMGDRVNNKVPIALSLANALATIGGWCDWGMHTGHYQLGCKARCVIGIHGRKGYWGGIGQLGKQGVLGGRWCGQWLPVLLVFIAHGVDVRSVFCQVLGVKCCFIATNAHLCFFEHVAI